MDEKQQMMQRQQQYETLLEQSTPIKCQSCGNEVFTQIYLMRRISAIVSPVGIDSIIPSPAYECSACGTLLTETVHPVILATDKNRNEEQVEIKPKSGLITDLS